MPRWIDDCGFEDTSKVEFVTEDVEVEGENSWVSGHWEDEIGQQCSGYRHWGYHGDQNHGEGAWVPLDTLPCAYARENGRLLGALPELPGAEEVAVDRYIYTRGEGPPFRHAILVTYDAPPGMSAPDVIDFYVQSFGSEWQYTVPDIGGAPWLAAQFTQGTAEVSVDTANMTASKPTFDVHIDARGAEPQ
jgi:hypothetical protein